jgi:hypothetical protein
VLPPVACGGEFGLPKVDLVRLLPTCSDVGSTRTEGECENAKF